MMFFESAPADLALPAGAHGAVIDHFIGCETNAACSPADGIVPEEPVRPWTTVTSFTVKGMPSPDDLEAFRRTAGAKAAVAVTEVDLLSRTTDRYAHKMLGVLRRRDDMSPEEFGSYWREHHSKVTISYEPTFGRYVTNTVAAVAGDFQWDGVVEQYYRTTQDLVDHVRLAREGRPRITEDIPRFVAHMIMFTTASAPGSAPSS
ncbi:EthD domain-containing protein [Jatrophihabitans cynanchi]|uniref:EthD domain-containing protein n=1 Tax=Jatrophihabitans cynanchi TaxID=2944128 RepID=A0ABY7K7R9_9ACTN|nr:EthD domain-containing protein [Jatrophihabitans sp. SB3-54]WAX59281.1 EthD domain-containing protein [Jatrophihabitans sp. SB3-54]